ncbi:MAG: WD40 repeat domain-containing protein, partial [Calditrichaceae bacterium]
MCKNHIKPFFLKPILFVLILTFSSCGLMEKDNGKTEDISPTEIFIQGVGLNVQRVAFNSDGSRLITSGNKGTTIWDMQAKKELINLYNNDAHSSAVSKSGRYLITFNPADHGLIKICDLTTFKIHSLRIFDKEESGYGRYISGITISDDEKYFALYSNKIMVFDLESLSQINHIELKSRHYLFDYRKQGLSFLPGTNDLLSISYDISFSEPDVVTEEGDLNLNQIDHYSVNIWDIKSKEPKIEIDLNCNFILSYALSPDNKKLALLLINKELRIIDIINRTVNNHRIEVERDIDAISYTNDGSILFANRKGIIGRYYSDSKKHIIINTDIRSRFRAYSCSDLAIANDGENIVFCSGYSTLLLYNVADNETTLLTDEAKNLFGAYYDSGTLVNILTSDKIFHQNGPSFNASEVKIKQLLSYVCADQLMIENIFSGEKQIFDLNLARTLFSGVIEENEEYYAITRDGKYGFKSLQQGENDNILAVYDMENTYSNPVLLEKSGGYGINIKVFNSNRKAIIAGFATDLLTIWDLQTGEIIDTLDIQSGNARAFDFIDDSKCLVGVRGIVRLYDMNSRNIIKSYIPKGYDGRYKDITKISFSPDKKYFATGDTDGLVTIWSFDNENELVSFKTHKDWITFLTFSPDGKNIISGSYSGKSLVISEVTTGKDIARFVAFADGEWIVITPKGYFNASPNGAKYLNVRVGNQVYSIDNFHEKYFNPAYVASVLQGKRI